ncbi:hypothetical protein [Halobacillus trueperi]|uniref:hypothetical protein n=1 Tax=Halobacillus trueperi TaxID=156205 RepID=UPI0037354361
MFDTMDWFLNVMKDEIYTDIDEEDVALEAVILEKDEIGMDVCPDEMSEDLPNSLLFETFSYDFEGDNYLGVVTSNEEADTIYFCRIFKNSKVLYTWVIGRSEGE